MRTRSAALFAGAALLITAGSAPAQDGSGVGGPGAADAGATGTASYYADRFEGRRTASGERLDQGELTAAHPTLPIGSRVEVTNLHNGKSVVVRVNDRGPFRSGRILDMTRTAAERLDMLRRGVATVSLRVLRPDEAGPLATAGAGPTGSSATAPD